MANADAAQQKIHDYLREVRAGLRGLPDAQASDFVEELRSHIRDRAESEGESTDAGVTAALDRLGRPEELAAMYLAENIVARAEKSFSPWLVLKGIVRWASISLAGVFVFFTSLAGYVLAASFGISALMKPFAPNRVGLWHLNGDPDNSSLVLGLGSGSPPTGTELLGWWIMPLGLLIGIGLFLLTARFGLWSLRKFQRMRPLPML